MNGYKISKLYINNFKLITNRELDFNSLDLFILDGPNGYGKTTIFDAIELLLTKKISRVEDNDVEDNKFKHKDSLFAKNINEPILIKGEFSKDNTSIVLVNYLDANENSKNWLKYKCYILDNYEDNVDQGILVDDFNNILGLDNNKIDLATDYKNFYYIQQENNTQFFKQSEKARIKLLSKFFATEDAEKLKKDLEEKLKKIKTIRESLDQKLKLKEDELKKLDEQPIVIQAKDIEYISLETTKPWDSEEYVPINKEKLQEVLTEIENIKLLLTNINNFQKYLKNEEYSELIKNDTEIERFIILENFKNDFKKFEDLVEKEKKYKEFQSIAREEDYVGFKEFNYKLKLEKLDIKNKENIFEKIDFLIKNIDDNIKEAGELSKLASNINEARKHLKERYTKFEDESKENGECPYCGYDGWKSFEKLEEEFKKKEKFFNNFKDEKTDKVVDFKNELFTKELKNISLIIDSHLENQENIISNDFFNQLQKYYNIDRLNAFTEKLKKVLLYDELKKYINTDRQKLEDIPISIKSFKETIEANIVKIEDTEFNEKKDNMLEAFTIYERKLDMIKILNIDIIKQKKEWIEQSYYTKEEEKKQKVITSIEDTKKKITLIKKVMESQTKGLLKTLQDKLDKKIKEQWQQVIKQIEIPLYIYSGKILQDTQRGNGVFIDYDTSKKQSPLKFLSTLESDYDATFSMSTGQLSALVVSLTLALNKVYGMNENGGVILIDDPMQSMDEMNVASFIELIRNDFENSQFILSTHESKISRLLHYKFLKYGKKVKNYSVKKEFFNEVI